jgi:hypothetical protein
MPESAVPEVLALARAIRAQEQALTELTASNEKQADTVAGVVLVLRALIDLVLNEEQRQALETHLVVSGEGDAPRTHEMIVGSLLD